jgi:hypothetical protein
MQEKEAPVRRSACLHSGPDVDVHRVAAYVPHTMPSDDEGDIGLISLSGTPAPARPPRLGLRRASTMSEAAPLSPGRLKRRSAPPAAFDMDVAAVARLRRWMLALVVGV